MITYKLNQDATYAMRIVEGVSIGEWHNTEISPEYLRWLDAENIPLPADE